jgi:polysaccharide export outer membrane protein
MEKENQDMDRMNPHLPAWRVRLAAAALAGAIGCGPMHYVGVAGGPTLLNIRFGPGPSAAPEATPAPAVTERLAHLRADRGPGGTNGDYVLGRGDLLSVRAFDFDQLNQHVRVESDGTVRLPLLNTVTVAGRTLHDVEQELTRRLGDYMYDPHVSVFVEEYRSQQVSVEGAVQKPGLINETGRNLTVLDSIAAAGGMTPEAGTVITFLPTRSQRVASAAAGDPACSGAAARDEVADDTPLVVNTAELDDDTRRAFFSLPVREGDVVRVQTAGNFYTTGWFDKPGAYPLHAGLTLRAAVAEAQGFSFPAKTDDVHIYRAGPNGKTQLLRVNYDQIAALKAPDVVLRDGDVIDVAGSGVKMVPWAAYKFLTTVVHIGYKAATGGAA